MVATRMSGLKESQVNFFIVNAMHYARAAVATIGILKFTYGCLSHELQVGTWTLFTSNSSLHTLATVWQEKYVFFFSLSRMTENYEK